jgi:hypothetical protein
MRGIFYGTFLHGNKGFIKQTFITFTQPHANACFSAGIKMIALLEDTKNPMVFS